MGPVNQVDYQSLSASHPIAPNTNPIVAVVKSIFQAIALFFSRLAYGLYNAVQLHRLGSKLETFKSVTTYNDHRSEIYSMFHNYTTNNNNENKVYDDFYADITRENRSYMKADDLVAAGDSDGKLINLDAFLDKLEQIVGSREGVHMITRILHQGLTVYTYRKIYNQLSKKNLIPTEPVMTDPNFVGQSYTVQKIGNEIVITAGILRGKKSIISDHIMPNYPYFYIIQKVIVPASKIGNIQSPLDFKTEEYYSPFFQNEHDVINRFYNAINYKSPDEGVQSDEEINE